jgi:hypothetical protein
VRFRNRPAKLQFETLNQDNLYKFLGEIGSRLLNKEISERQAELGLSCVQKYLHGVEMFQALQKPTDPKQEPATKDDVAAVATAVNSFRLKFDGMIEQQKRQSGMWG